MNNVVISDHLTEGTGSETYIADSFRLVHVEMDSYGNNTQVYETVDLTGKLNVSSDKKSFTLNLGNINGQQYRLTYRTTYTPGTTLRNNVTLNSNEQSKTTTSTHISANSGGSGTGTRANKIKLTKVDAENNKPLENAVFTVTASDGSSFELTTGADGTVTSGFLTQGTYKVKEKPPPLGYELNEEEFSLVVNSTGGALKTITDKPIKINIQGIKTWDDGNNQDGKRPEKITVNLLKNGIPFKEAEVKADGDGNWKYSFDNLRKYENDQEIKYTVTENAVAEYTPGIDGYNIKNSYTPKKTSVTVTKKWDDADNQDGKRPSSIKVQLYGNDKKVGEEVTLNEGNSWTHTWAKLPKNAAGIPIKYTVKEVGEVDNYTTSYGEDSQGNIIITNKHVPEKTKVEGQKTWSDNDNQDGKRPESITVNLLADGRKVKEVKVTAATDWKYSFTDLPKYENGRVIKYTVTENTVDDYNTEIEGYDIKNSYTPEETSVTVTKRWNDSNDKDRIRPERIKVQLYANGEKKGKAVELKVGSNWSYTWNRLPKKAKGKDIKYTVKEEGSPSGYTVSVDDKDHGNIIITNSHTPKEITRPKTGDANRFIAYLAVMLLSAATVIGLLVSRRRIRN